MSIAMTEVEQKQIDSQVEPIMAWAKTRKAEAEQLAMDAARLMSCTSVRLDKLKKQGFFKRCWNRLTGKTGEIERANAGDLIQMQKMGFRYLNMLQEQQVLMAHSMLSLKNNLLSLAVKEEETRGLVALLAQRTQERFLQLETRVDQLEVSTNLQGWLLGLEERDYNENIPTEYMRLFRVINDFYCIKNDEWNYNDLMFMRKAIRTVGIDPKKKLSLNALIDGLTDEIQSESVGFESYGQAITLFKPEGIENYSKFVIDNISSPVFVSMHGLKTQYMDRLDIVEELQEEMNISAGEALKRLLRRSIANLNVNLDYEFPLAEAAIEILGCLRLTEKLALPSEIVATEQDINEEITAIEISNESEIAKIEETTITPLPQADQIFIEFLDNLSRIKLKSRYAYHRNIEWFERDKPFSRDSLENHNNAVLYTGTESIKISKHISNLGVCLIKDINDIEYKTRLAEYVIIDTGGNVRLLSKEGQGYMAIMCKNIYINHLNACNECFIVGENIFINEVHAGLAHDHSSTIIAKNIFLCDSYFKDVYPFDMNADEIEKLIGEIGKTKILKKHRNILKEREELADSSTFFSLFSRKKHDFGRLSAKHILFESDAGFECYPQENAEQIYSIAKEAFKTWTNENNVLSPSYWFIP